MNGEVEREVPGFLVRVPQTYESAAGQSLATWLILALLNFGTQALLWREMTVRPDWQIGEFGTLNAALAIIGLLTMPVLALHHAFRLFFARAQPTSLDLLRASSITLTETMAWVWGACCFILVLVPLPLPFLPRFSLQIFTLMNVLLALGGVVSLALCGASSRRWAILIICMAASQLITSGCLTAYEPWTEAGLTAFLVAAFVTLGPALQRREISVGERLKACASALNGDFLLFAAATISVFVGVYLFINADRIAVLAWVDNLPTRNPDPGVYVGEGAQRDIDAYQATALLARGLLWGTQPLLWMLYEERSRLTKTTSSSLRFFWIYLGTLVGGAFVLGCLTQKNGLIDSVITTTFVKASHFGPTFAAVMVPLGFLQALGIFSLASRRYPECFVFGTCSLAYSLVLASFGRRPDLMLPYMFGMALVSIMAVLFVGVVRWGRKQP